ncbi:PREDICTED: dedicator of cytokinesis protein 9-like [Amphimedon queenslandica]|nr:PREDICTED: dedicator of cytokinesis protein 9-like [Amphimedon queenslandica]|eukprot:XP_019861021.1 PREDICTED: dedicator of cytokinesis protein 9-like [Amphimedon queenslandica]
MKPTDSLKMVDKFSKQVTSVRERLGQYRMPFAWAAKPLFLSEDEVNVHCTDLGPIYRQEREKLTDTELIKILSDFKNIGRHKLQTIPGSLNVSIIGSATPGVIFTPSYLPVKSTVPRQLTPDTQSSLEVREFLSLDSCDSFSHCSPHISHINHFYVYPVSLKYDTQKSFPKARNIAVTIEVRDNDTDRYTRPLKVIYSKLSSDELLVDSVTTPVLYHCTYPTFYDEEEKERISGLFFPLLTITLRHSSKLHKGREEPPPLTPSVPPTPGTAPPLTPPSDPEPANTDEGTGPPSLLKKSSQGNIKLNPITGAAPGIEAINPLDITGDDQCPDGEVSQPSSPSPLSPSLSPDPNVPAPPPVPPVSVNACSFNREETRDLLICFLFVVKHLNDDVLNQWWQDCVDAPVPLSRTYSLSNRLEDQAPVGGAGGGAYNESNEISAFFDILESCAHVFEYSGRISITKKWSSRSVVLKRLEEMYTTDET